MLPNTPSQVAVGDLNGDGRLDLVTAPTADGIIPQASQDNRAGEGTVDAKVGDNGNTDVEVRVKHLADASKVEADASVYVVWLKPRNAAIQNIGALEVDSDLVGQLNTTTPHRAFTLSVTPEPSARMSRPSHDAVFTSDVAVAAE